MASAIVQNVLARANEDEAENIKSIQVDKAIDVEFDLGNLLAYDPNDIDVNILRSDKETLLTNLARDDVQLLINRIFALPTDRVDNEIVVKLPEPTTRLPRAKPVPKQKQLTKWEKFAREKGINTKKKTSAEWDEELQKWVPRFGFKKAQAEKEKNWVVEMTGNEKDDEDPRAKLKKKKQEAVAKNELQRLRNISKKMKIMGIIMLNVAVGLSQLLKGKLTILKSESAKLAKFEPKLVQDYSKILMPAVDQQLDDSDGDDDFIDEEDEEEEEESDDGLESSRSRRRRLDRDQKKKIGAHFDDVVNVKNKSKKKGVLEMVKAFRDHCKNHFLGGHISRTVPLLILNRW
nr:EOG090X0CBY [Sida crystallina]